MPLGQQKYFMHRDAQGSLVMLTDETGAAKQQFSYDAWGRRVWVNNPALLLSASALLPVSTQRTTEGFGGHDMLDAMGLVHMGGRIYDPRLGRFVQADPFVGAPAFLQAFNRYAYVFDMPLRFTDPNGFNGAGDDAATLGSSMGNSPFGTGTVLPTVYVFASYENSYTSFDAMNGYGFGGSALEFNFGNVAAATPKALSVFVTAGRGAADAKVLARSEPHRGPTKTSEFGGAFKPGSAEESIGLDCLAGVCFGRSLNSIYVTGHRVRGIGPYHTALEFDGGDGVEWISAGFAGYTFEGMDRLVVGVGNLANGMRPTDAPSRNIALGRVIPPMGLSADEYFDRLKEATVRYQQIAAGAQPMTGQGADSAPPIVDYDLFPGIANGYNSNSFLHGLLDATGGTTTIDLNDFIGGEKPLPAIYFGR
jgi:RHS repeat-associated protein